MLLVRGIVFLYLCTLYATSKRYCVSVLSTLYATSHWYFTCVLSTLYATSHWYCMCIEYPKFMLLVTGNVYLY